MKATKLLRQGCQGFLITMLDKKEVQTRIEDELIVNEYLDVFSEELLGLPPYREIKCSKDLLSGTIPISKTPYRMAPAEVKELKV